MYVCSAGALRRVGVHGSVCNVCMCVQPVLFDVLVYTVPVCNVYMCVQPVLFDVLVYTVQCVMCVCVFSRCSSTCWCTWFSV